MDFYSLSRRDLQSLCKKNRIPANITNIAMADALQALQSVEGIGEIQEALLQYQSPKKLDLVSPAPPRTSRRTASRKVGPAKEEEPQEQQGSPLPRSRRVTARPSLMNLVDEAKEEDGKNDVAETPKVPNMRRRGSKKEEGLVEASMGQKTVNTRTGRRASAIRVAENKKEEKPVGVTTGRRTRQSSKKEVEVVVMDADLMSGGLRRSTRLRASVVKMASLAKEEEEEKEEKVTIEVEDEKNDLCPEEVVAGTKEEDKETTVDLCSNSEDCEQEQNLKAKSKDEGIQEVPSSELSGVEGSPIRGLISTDRTQNNEDQDSDHQQNPSTEITAVEENEMATDDGEFNLQDLPLSGEIPQGNQNLETPATCDQIHLNSETPTEIEESSGDNSKDNDLTVEAIESEITVESLAEIAEAEVSGIKSPVKQPIGDSSKNLEIPITCVQISPNASPDLTDEIPAEAKESTGEIFDNITEEIKAETVESGDGDGKITEEDDDNKFDDLAVDISVDIPVEIDETGDDLISSVLAGEISVEAIEDPATEIDEESLVEVGELIADLSDLNLSEASAGKELPVAGIYSGEESDNKETSDLTSSTVMEVGPLGGGGAKVKSMAEKQSYNEMSLRKLKAFYKETLVTMNNKGEEKRAALKAVDEKWQ